eukprot:TRINITY_DN811_c0_g2_i1.p1 TRINITY_DN811_c0_g2~~TRINITY_DN811_c0_g2_i1.p1  ORF type:complete len:1116 (-),score=308.71 TRINITY_DN811_c0_g2_i1:300-3647(-)
MAMMNSTIPEVPEGLASTTFMSAVGSSLWAFFMATRTELFLFFVAVTAYATLFGNANPRASPKGSKAKKTSKDDFENQKQPQARRPEYQDKDVDNAGLCDLEKMLQVAFAGGDHRFVSRCWTAMKKFEETPTVSLADVAESLQRTKKDSKAVSSELLSFFQKHSNECHISAINDIMDSLSRRLDTAFAQQIMEMLPVLELKPDARTCELLLSMHFTTRNFAEVKRLVEEMKKSNVPLTVRSTVTVIKAALKESNFNDAMVHFKQLRKVWENYGEAKDTPSMAPQHIISQLVDTACKEHMLTDFLPLLSGVPLNNEVVGTMLSECIRQKDARLAGKVEHLAREQSGFKFSENGYSLLIKAAASKLGWVKTIVEEIANSGKELNSEICLAVLGCCAQHKTEGLQLAQQLESLAQPLQVQILSGFIRYYAANGLHEQVCQIYKRYQQDAAAASVSIALDSRAEKALMNSALKCGRHDLAQGFLEAMPSDVAKHVTMIRNCSSDGNLEGAKKVFESLKSSGGECNSVVYNTVLDACVENNALKEAEVWMDQMKKDGLADVVSYNTVIKAHLQVKNFEKARALMDEMKKLGFQPNGVTFNELVNGLVAHGSHSQRAEIWKIIAQMKEAGVAPNQVTCSILLKSLNYRSSDKEVHQTMDLISAMEESMDEVLLSSVVEALVRINRPDLLRSKLKMLQKSNLVKISGSHTFGSLFKAYGFAKDIDGVWRCWKEMRSRYIKPTSITLGCMVEAVVNNGDTEGGYELIHEIQADENCKDMLNSVIYCSVLKGFTREKKLDRAWNVYSEMKKYNVDISIVTYNTLIDACARCGQMQRMPEILNDMATNGAEANLITYSTRIKGHCSVGELEQGFQVLEQMRRETKMKPDEIMYNSLLDGCAQNGLVEEGLKLLETMQDEGVSPSNFTLSLLVKMMSRARKLDNAFQLVDEISAKFHLQPNVHVYTNLIQACIYSRQLPRAMNTMETMLEAHIQPESRTYNILVRACLQQGKLDLALGLLRAALGLQQFEVEFLEKYRSTATCYNLDYSLVSECLMGLLDHGGRELAAQLLTDVKQHKPNLHIDASVHRRLLSDVGDEQMHRSGKGGGKKGSGKGSSSKGYSQNRY